MTALLYILLAVTPFLITTNMWDYAELPKALFLRNGVILLAILFFWKRRRDIHISKTFMVLGGFIFWAAITLFWAVDPASGLETLSHWIVCALFLLLVQNMNINTKNVLITVFLAAWIVAMIGLGQHFFRLDWFWQSSKGPASTFGNANIASRYIAMSIPIGVALIFVIKHKSRWLVLIPLLIMGGFIVAADHRAGMVALSIVTVVLLLLHQTRRIRTIGACLALLLLFVIIAYRPDFFSAHTKIVRQKNTLELISEHPIVGVGLGNFDVYYDRYGGANAKDAHNDYAQIWCELGLVGLLAFALLCIVAFKSSRGYKGIYGTAMKCGLVIFMIMAGFSFPLELSVEPFMATLYLGLLK